MIDEIVVFWVRLAGEAIAVAGRRNNNLYLTAPIEDSAGEELIGAVSQRGNTGDAVTVFGQRIM
ncbi:MAG TPA: hypothetical protein VK887_11860 [Pseudonocardiaceae bacterium]|nr:hypothetical protein [Pseudonocardiaceae bacterium]